jgi:hypothetical protein
MGPAHRGFFGESVPPFFIPPPSLLPVRVTAGTASSNALRAVWLLREAVQRRGLHRLLLVP